jgi:hypothetical protein
MKKRNKRGGPSPVSASQQLLAEPVEASEVLKTVVTRGEDEFTSAKFVSSSLFPAPEEITMFPQELKFTDTFSLFVGDYLVIAHTGRGKTIASAALCAWANDIGIRATYAQVFEPRAPQFKPLAETQRGAQAKDAGIADIKSFTGLRIPFTDTVSFWRDFDSLIGAKTGKPGLIVLDSITDAIKANATERFKGQPTFPGGMQPSDRDFLIQGAARAKQHNVCLLLTINSQLIPYAAELSGATEGLLKILDVKRFTRNDRSAQTIRRDAEQEIPTRYVNAALKAFGMGTYNESAAGTFRRDFVGL